METVAIALDFYLALEKLWGRLIYDPLPAAAISIVLYVSGSNWGVFFPILRNTSVNVSWPSGRPFSFSQYSRLSRNIRSTVGKYGFGISR